ncbi:MAG: hypothetical protein AB9861_03955 [Methanosarcina sp.]
MIKINKTQPAPGYIRYVGTSREEDKCQSETQLACEYFESGDYNPNNKYGYKFKSSIYGNKIWKEQLLKDQFDKCCFCESKVAHIDAGDVEHYRPKGESKQTDSDPANKPGYYWLAYDWDNLLIACQRCNRRKKKSLFPLLNPDERASSTNKNIAVERPVFINPCIEDPKNFIKFNLEYPVGIDDNGRGEKTLDELNLVNDETLNEIRRNHLEIVNAFIDSIKINIESLESLNDETLNDASRLQSIKGRLSNHLKILLNYLEDSSSYAGMIRSNLEGEIQELRQRYRILDL